MPIQRKYKRSPSDQSRLVAIAHLGHGVVAMEKVARVPGPAVLVQRVAELQVGAGRGRERGQGRGRGRGRGREQVRARIAVLQVGADRGQGRADARFSGRRDVTR